VTETVPVGARLVHIGFDKTGTTSLQGSFHGDRERLRANGVIYPGSERYQKSPGVAVTAARGNTGDRPVTMADWDDLVAEVAAAPPAAREFVSSEWLCRATDEQARTVVEGLGGTGPRDSGRDHGAVHVVATIRPLAKILPSAWQQYVKDGFTGDYESWLRGMLLEPPYQQPTPWFWIRHSHDVVLARWAALVGPANVTAIVVDERDRELLFRQFESLLALPAGFLVPEPERKQNASLTWPEAEMLRMVNQAFVENGWSDELYGDLVRAGLTPRLATARAAVGQQVPITTPRWALERAAAVGAAAAAAINALGVRVLGDLDSLGQPPVAGAADPVAPKPMVAVQSVALAVAGILLAAQREPRPAPTAVAGRPISDLPEF
jgi:hypothetical protein